MIWSGSWRGKHYRLPASHSVHGGKDVQNSGPGEEEAQAGGVNLSSKSVGYSTSSQELSNCHMHTLTHMFLECSTTLVSTTL